MNFFEKLKEKKSKITQLNDEYFKGKNKKTIPCITQILIWKKS